MDIRAMGTMAQAHLARAKRLREEAAQKAAEEAERIARGETVQKPEPEPEVDAWTRMQG